MVQEVNGIKISVAECMGLLLQTVFAGQHLLTKHEPFSHISTSLLHGPGGLGWRQGACGQSLHCARLGQDSPKTEGILLY